MSLDIVGDFSVPGGFNVTITFSGDDEMRPFPLEILDDQVGEGNETIELLVTTPGSLDGIKPGVIYKTTITIIEDDCKTCLLSAVRQINY